MWSYHGKPSRSLSSWLCFLALLCTASVTLGASDVAPQETTIYESELTRLKAISERLQVISAVLSLGQETSLKKIDELLNELADLKSELSALKDESATLRIESEASAKKSTELAAEAKKSEALASSLETSFKAYRADAEREIARLEKKARLLGLAAGSGWISTVVLVFVLIF